MKGGKLIGKFLQENLFFIVAMLLLASFPFSESLLSITVSLLFAQVLFTGQFKEKWKLIRTDSSLRLLSGVYIFYLLGCLVCQDRATGLYELKKTIFWVLVPMGVALSSKLNEKRFWLLLLVLVVFVTIGTFITSYKIFNADAFHITDVRDASFISHISFAFQIIFSFFILLYGLIKRPFVFRKINRIIIVVWSIWFLVFLILQKSLLGILTFYFAALFFSFWIIRFVLQLKYKSLMTAAVIVFGFLPFMYIGWVVVNFYTVKDKWPNSAEQFTARGNEYSFKIEDKQKENGHYVNWFICKDEMEEEWNRRSSLGFEDRDSTGYRVYYTLIRYLTSKGLKKDAEGVQALSTEDITNIEKGISNHIFVDKRYSLYPRIYQTVWEIDEYRNTGNPNNQSLSQRFEYVKAALYIIKHNFWGIGTGNYKIEFADAYVQIDTKLNREFRFHVHNQYLSYMVKFGLMGLILIVSMISYAIYRKRQSHNILLSILLVMMVVSNFGEAILETHEGLPFFLFFIALFLWHSPASLFKSNGSNT
ncbi:MAG: O-antigen ligase family protein [Prolixibacteraceae bacterium]